jgi:hypothetical protein
MPLMTTSERLAIAKAELEEFKKGWPWRFERGWPEGFEKRWLEGFEKGWLEGLRQGLLQTIEVCLHIKFGAAGMQMLPDIGNLTNVSKLDAVLQAIEKAASPEEVRRVWAP